MSVRGWTEHLQNVSNHVELSHCHLDLSRVNSTCILLVCLLGRSNRSLTCATAKEERHVEEGEKGKESIDRVSSCPFSSWSMELTLV